VQGINLHLIRILMFVISFTGSVFVRMSCLTSQQPGFCPQVSRCSAHFAPSDMQIHTYTCICTRSVRTLP
jgi:hypothetical protein